MKRIYSSILLIAAIVNFTATFNAQTGINKENTKLITEIAGVLRGYYDAFSRRDVVAAVNYWADDGFSYDGGYSTTRELKEILPAYLRSPVATSSKDSYEVEDLKVLPVTVDVAVANYTVITRTELNGKVEVQRDRSTNVFARHGSRWEIIVDHTSRMAAPIVPTVSGMPVGWIRTPANSSSGYSISVDTNVKHDGKASATIRLSCPGETGFGSLGQAIAADDFRGKRVRLSGWLKTENAESAGLWMRIDGDRRRLGFDNMSNRAASNTTVWTRYEVVLDVPPDAINVVFGALLSGKGQAWIDGLKLDTVGANVPSTNMLSPEQMSRENLRTLTRSEVKQPVNLSFEKGIIP